MSFVGEKIVAGLREDLYAHLQKLSLSYFDRTATGLLMSRIINDVNLIQGAVSSAVTGILKDSFTILGLIGVIFYRDWQLAILAILVLPIAVFPIVKFGRKLRKISTQSQKTMADISIHLHETLTGNRIVKAFNTEDYEIERFQSAGPEIFSVDHERRFDQIHVFAHHGIFGRHRYCLHYLVRGIPGHQRVFHPRDFFFLFNGPVDAL